MKNRYQHFPLVGKILSDQPVLLIIFSWLVSFWIVFPFGEFPLNDDWAYAQNVYNLVENNTFHFSDWPAMTLIAHTLWGSIFVELFGFSFLILRFSIWLLGLTAVLTLYYWLLKITGNKRVALFASFVLGFNPLFFVLSYSFMTDVSFVAAMLLSLYFYHSCFYHQKSKYLIIASFFALVATMIRQTGIVLPFGFLIVYLLTKKIKVKTVFLVASLALIILAALISWPWIMKQLDHVPEDYATINDLLYGLSKPRLFYSIYFRSSMLLIYYGIFLSPFLVLILPDAWKSMGSKFRIRSVFIALLALLPVLHNLKHFPAGNEFYDMGLGPKVLKDTYWNVNMRPDFPLFARILIYSYGIAGAFAFTLVTLNALGRLLNSKFREPKSKMQLFILLLIIAYLAFLLTGVYFFDRYYIPLIPLIILLLLPEKTHFRRWTTRVASLLFIPILWFSVAATHDYFAWNRARWNGLEQLMKSGIKPSEIDGGFEFNAWYQTGPMNKLDRKGKSWWFVKEDQWAVTFGPWEGFSVDSSLYYFSFLTLQKDSLLTLKKEGEIPSSSHREEN